MGVPGSGQSRRAGEPAARARREGKGLGEGTDVVGGDLNSTRASGKLKPEAVELERWDGTGPSWNG